jgi:hypothetical protein
VRAAVRVRIGTQIRGTGNQSMHVSSTHVLE